MSEGFDGARADGIVGTFERFFWSKIGKENKGGIIGST